MAGQSMESLGLLETEHNGIPDIHIDPSLTAEPATDNYPVMYVLPFSDISPTSSLTNAQPRR